MLSTLLLVVFIAYTLMLFAVAWLTSRKADQNAFYIGNRKSNWLLVAYGMIGASLSGVTFMSVPGTVYKGNFHYFQLVLAFLISYSIIAFVLLPLYYRLNLTSIYTYLEQRFGFCSYKTGAAFFFVSRLLGAAIRTYIVIMVLHVFVLERLGVPFWVVGLTFILLAIAYTYQGGVKTIVWTDMIQTTFMLLAVIVTLIMVIAKLDLSFGTLCTTVFNSDYSNIFDTDWKSNSFFLKHLLAGIFVPIAMTGLDQGMMQKNLSCKNIGEAQKNMMTGVSLIIVVNFVFLFLGAALVLFCNQNGITVGDDPADTLGKTDMIFPHISFNYLGVFAGICFFVGLISAAYPSCANALTALTTSVCIDLVGLEKRTGWSEKRKKHFRHAVQCVITLLFLAIILLVNALNNDAIVNLVYSIASYTYGPLLALYIFGLYTKRCVKDVCVPVICIVAPLICLVVERYNLIGLIIGQCTGNETTFSFGFSLLLVNAALTTLGLFLCGRKNTNVQTTLPNESQPQA